MNLASKALVAGGFTTGVLPRGTVLREVARIVEKEQAQLASEWGVTRRLGWDTLRTSHENVQPTAFILGTGASIRELSSANFCHIAESTSVGLNSWLTASNFVPSFLLAENVTRSQWDAVGRHASDERLRAILMTRYAGIYFSRGDTRIRRQLPNELASKTYHYSTVPLLGRGRLGTRKYFEHLLNFANSRQTLTGPTSTSLERAIVMLGLSGYRRIVLCGADLRGPYWWEEPGVGERPVLTNTWRVVAGPVSSRLPILASVIKKRMGASVEVASGQVFLAEHLPVYDGWGA